MPAGLSTQILQSINEASASSDQTTQKAQPKAASSGKGGIVLPIILGVALLGSLIGGFLLNQQKDKLQTSLDSSNAQVSALNTQLTDLQIGCDERSQTIEQLEEQIGVLKNPAYRPVSMSGTAKAPDAIATVYYNPAEQKSFLDLGTLPTAPTDRDYQLWAIVDGVPTDMGIFDLSRTDGLVVVPHIRNPQAFAITLETKGGNPTPNLDELVVIGEV